MTGTGDMPYSGTDDADLEPGQTVGEYVVEEKLGEGGFGTVFKAVHPVIGKQVAIKVLARQYSVQREMVSRFVSEARAVNQIRHRNIIDIFSFGQLDDGRHYYVMELLDGEPMDEYLEARGRIDLSEAIPILRALARALDAAHAKGIAHRDLKPENIFLARDADGTVFPKLLDFGIAKLLGEQQPHEHRTRTGAPMGTPAYMSPEQCRGRDVDHRTDIYAFGILTYQMLTGELPFDGEDYMEILLKQISEEPDPPSTRHPGLPASVDHAVLWMLAKDPAKRPPNLVTAVRALEDAARSAGVRLSTEPEPTGAYAAPTTPPMSAPRPPASAPAPVSGAPTVALDASVGPAGPQAPASPNGSTAAELAALRHRGSRRLAVVVGSVVAAVAAGTVVYMALSGDDVPPPDPAVERAAHTAPPAAPDAAASRRSAVPDAAPPIPAIVTIDVSGPPPGTEVFGPLGPVGVAPGPIQLPRGDRPVVLTFKAAGYRTVTAEVTPDRDAAIEVRLKKKPPRRRPPKPTKRGRDAIEDPFK